MTNKCISDELKQTSLFAGSEPLKSVNEYLLQSRSSFYYLALKTGTQCKAQLYHVESHMCEICEGI